MRGGFLTFLMASALAFGATAPSQAETITLKFSQFLGPTSFFAADVVEPWARELETRTKGQVRVERIDGSMPLGKVTEQAGNVRDGKVDIALGLRGAEGNKFPGSSVIELPFLVPSADKSSRALWALYKDGTLADEYRDYKVLALFVHNPGLVHTATKPIEGPADLKGLRLRSPNATVSAALKQLGAEPALLQVDEIVPALKDNRLDGIVTNWGNPIPNFNDYMKHHTDIQFYTSAFFILMNKARFDSLPKDVQAAIDDISGDAWVAKFGAYWNKWDEPVRAGANGPGHQVLRPDAAKMQAWREALRPVSDQYLDELAARFPAARGVYQKLSSSLQ